MKTQFKDVAHLYLGCEGVAITEPRGIERLIGLTEKTLVTNLDEIIPDDFKPILRPLSDITESEMIEWADSNGYDLSKEDKPTQEIHKLLAKGLREKGINFLKVNDGEFELIPKFILFSLKYHFDIFGLIESGQAIDKTTIQ